MAPIASKCCFVEPPHEVITSWIHATVMSFVSMILHNCHCLSLLDTTYVEKDRSASIKLAMNAVNASMYIVTIWSVVYSLCKCMTVGGYVK